MSRSSLVRATVLFAALAPAPSARSQDPTPLPLPIPSGKPENKVEPPDPRVTTVDRGPVHEGFAQPGANVRGKGVTAPFAPPPPVSEIPPEPRPEGKGVQWIPGYWHWDTDRDDFIWVCGCYRNAPPDRAWEAGHWKAGSEKGTYFPGYWRPTDPKPLPSNLPEPPASTEAEPIAPSENPTAMWVPGLWEYKNDKFEWQPGYWPASFEQMNWQQAQYVKTETGFVCVPGYWDYPLEERGLLFAPMYFSQAQREKRGWSYRPQYVITFGSGTGWGQGGVFDSLYIGPGYNNYYFGNFSWWDVGGPLPVGELPPWNVLLALSKPLLVLAGYGAYQPWYSVTRGYTNPLWQHYARLNRNDATWSKNVETGFTNRATSATGFTSGTGPCPPRGLVIGSAAVVGPTRVTSTLAFVQPATQVLSRQSARVISTDGGLSQQVVTKNTLAYQHMSRHGVLTTGVVQYRTVSPPIYPVGGYRR